MRQVHMIGGSMMGPMAGMQPNPMMGCVAMLNELVSSRIVGFEMPSPTGPVSVSHFEVGEDMETREYVPLKAVHLYNEGGTASHTMVFKKTDEDDISDAHIAERYPVAPMSMEAYWGIAHQLHTRLSEESLLEHMVLVKNLPRNLKIGDTLVLRKGQPEDNSGVAMNFMVKSIVPEQRVIYGGATNVYGNPSHRGGLVYVSASPGDCVPDIREVDLSRYERADKPLLSRKERKEFALYVEREGNRYTRTPPLSYRFLNAMKYIVQHAAGIILAGVVLASIFGIPMAHAVARDDVPLVMKPITLPEKQPSGYSYVYCVNKECHDIYTGENILIDNVDKDGYYGYTTD